MDRSIYFGVDVGGTYIKCARLRGTKILKRITMETRAREGLAVSLQQILTAINRIGKDAVGIGIGIAGIIDSKHGIVRYSPNMPGWDEVPLARLLERKSGVPVRILNDVNAACLGEWQYGAAKGCDDVFMLTVGTGVGGAAVCAGHLQFGAHGFAGEFGHIIIKENGKKCACGNRGCLEAYVGVQPITRLARRLLRNRKSSLHEVERITPRSIAREAKKGDRVACEVYARIGHYLGIGITNIVHLYDPQVVIVSGGISNAGRILFDPLRRTVKECVIGSKFRRYRIVPPALADDAGILGAVYFARSGKHSKH
jgi:glucokinase